MLVKFKTGERKRKRKPIKVYWLEVENLLLFMRIMKETNEYILVYEFVIIPIILNLMFKLYFE